MIDFDKIEQYRENNRIEAKRALGGLPKSIWETYSAFANTLGGLILLGVEEQKDKSFRTVDLPDPKQLVREFWSLVNDPHKASANILTDEDVRIETVNGNRIIVIRIPRAERIDKPVYVDGDANTGTYWRSGEGDHRCTPEQVAAMRRDAAVHTQDMRLIRDRDADVLRGETLRSFRLRMRLSRPGHAWEALDDEDFLLHTGAADRDTDGKIRPTAAGILMFTDVREIRRIYPNYSLRFAEGEHSAACEMNLYDFYFDAMDRLSRASEREEAVGGIREALGNCLINADYHSRAGVEIVMTPEYVAMTNPGFFRIGVSDAVNGGRSDPRNANLMRMFNLLGVGESAGGGIPGIFSAWSTLGWSEPVITQSVGPGRVTVTLPLGKTHVKKNGKRTLPARTRSAIRAAARRDQIIDYLTDHVSAGLEELCALTGLKPSGTTRLLRLLQREGVITRSGSGEKKTYSLTS